MISAPFHSLLLVFILTALYANVGQSSNLYHFHDDLISAYSGPIMVDNSQFVYPASEKLNFHLREYILDKHSRLLPLVPTINTWAAMHSIHPRVLTEVVASAFQHKQVRGDFEDRQMVFELSSGLVQNFDKSEPLSATQALFSMSQLYGFELDFPQDFALKKHWESPMKGVAGPPLFGYLQPPWPRGEFWAGGGVHANTGGGSSPRNSLDFFGTFVGWGGDTSNIWVSASQSGIARVWSSCSVSVIHPNGWETFYYHLDNVQVTDMQSVISNQQLANYADNEPQALCQGGFSTGPHVHFAVFYNGTAIEIDESSLDFSSWIHKAGEGHYDSNCSRSYYTLIPSSSIICPFVLQLPNTTDDDFIYANGFD